MFNRMVKIFERVIDIAVLQFCMIIFSVMSLVPMGAVLDMDKDIIAFMIAAAPLVVLLFLVLTIGAVKLGAIYTEYATRGEHSMPIDWILLDGKDMGESLTWYWFTIMLFVYIAMILFYVPLSVTLSILAIIGLTKLSRFAFGIKGRLKSHIDDPEAHSNKE